MHLQLAVSVGGPVHTHVLLGLEHDDVARLQAGETIRGQVAGLGEEVHTLEVVFAADTDGANGPVPGRPRLVLTKALLDWARDAIPVTQALRSLGLQHDGELVLIHRATDDATRAELKQLAARFASTLQPDTSHVTTYALDRKTGKATRTVRVHDDAPPGISLFGLAVGALAALVMLVEAFRARDSTSRSIFLALATIVALVLARPARDAWRAKR
jgi:hypothetical protein